METEVQHGSPESFKLNTITVEVGGKRYPVNEVPNGEWALVLKETKPFLFVGVDPEKMIKSALDMGIELKEIE